MSSKLTIEDIARLAGVSKATVSRVLNQKPDVDPKTRERVLRIVEEEGFVPSITASGLAVGRSRLIGVLVPSLAWPFIAGVIQGVADMLDSTSYEMVLYSNNKATNEQESSNIIDHILATRLTSGLLAIFPSSSFITSAHYIALLQSHKFPVVLIDDHEESVDVPYVTANNYAGALEAVRHLISLGHRRIAHIKGQQDVYSARERYRGYLQALEDAGIPLDLSLVKEGNYNTPAGRIGATQLFALPPDERPTAIFAANDPTAYGVLAAAEEHGIVIPDDVALVGFDDISLSRHIRPALTTVRQPFYEMGQQATIMLLSMLNSLSSSTGSYTSGIPNAMRFLTTPVRHNGKQEHVAYTAEFQAGYTREGEPVQLQLPTRLIVRASCGSPDRLSLSSSLS
jgi:LacI family transcriptional regulator